MIVSELIAKLQTMPQDARVAVSLSQSEYADMCGIGGDGGTGNVEDDCYVETNLGGTPTVYISGDVEISTI